MAGWAFDDDLPTAPVNIHVYIGGPAGAAGAEGHAIGTAAASRPDVGAIYSGRGNSRGFSKTFTTNKRGQQAVYVYAINIDGAGSTGGSNVLLGVRSVTITSSGAPSVTYSAHVQTYGWLTANDGKTAGTVGEGLRLEALTVNLNNAPSGAHISYRMHIQSTGWQEWKSDGDTAGTVGEARRAEAVQMVLTGADGWQVVYRVHVQGLGWQGWKTSNQTAGTIGEARRIEAIQIKLEPTPNPTATYRAHVQSAGWQGNVNDCGVAGTTGEAKRMEALEISMNNAPAGAQINYRMYLQGTGWQGWKKNGQTAGTVGQGLRTEAIQIKLTGVTGWHVLYRVYLQGSGWQEWKKDGETAGTVGESKRMEAIQISLSRNPYLSVTGITLNKSTSKISVGSSETLAAAVTPGYATSQNITWTSSNPSVASVSSGGKVSGVSAGSATIVARTPDGAITAACTYTVAAASSMAISWHTIVPDPLTAGTGVTVKGTVSSAYPISEITAQIRIGTSTGTPVYIVSARPNTTTFNLSQWDDDLLFSKLGPGNYVYFVKARDSQGVLKELYVKSFTVQAANAATSRILDNIKNSPNIPAGEKTDACIETAKIMLENGYEPSFVAGMLANICKEGAAGKFESSNYVSHPEKEPDYLRYMDAHHGYRSKYSGQYIYNNIDVREVYELLKSFDQQDWNIGGSRVGFGLGSVQWTFSRTYTLVQLYLEVNGNQRIISRPQVIQAESLMILRELQGGYQHVYTNWKAANSANLNSQIAAGAAGDTLCYNYEKPKSRATSRYERADLARAIYADMMK